MIQEQRDRTGNPANIDEAQSADRGPDQAAPSDTEPAGAPDGSLLPSVIDAASIFAGLAAGVTVQDEHGHLVFANAIAARMSGYPSPEALLAAAPADLVGRIELIDEKGDRFDWDRLPGRRILAGEEPEPTLVGFRERPTGLDFNPDLPELPDLPGSR